MSEVSEAERDAVVGVAKALNKSGCSNPNGAYAFYDMALELLFGSPHNVRLAAHDNYKENNQ